MLVKSNLFYFTVICIYLKLHFYDLTAIHLFVKLDSTNLTAIYILAKSEEIFLFPFQKIFLFLFIINKKKNIIWILSIKNSIRVTFI